MKIKSKEDGLQYEDLIKFTEYLKKQNQKLQVQAIDVRDVEDFGESASTMTITNIGAHGGVGPSFDNSTNGPSLTNAGTNIQTNQNSPEEVFNPYKTDQTLIPQGF